MAILTVGIELANNVFVVHGINEAGKAALVRPAVVRDCRQADPGQVFVAGHAGRLPWAGGAHGTY